MMRILLDENIPAGLRKLLPGHETRLAAEVGLAGVSNDELLAAAERLGFRALITADSNLRYQQNLTRRAIAIVALGTNHWRTISQNPAPIIEALGHRGPGSFIEVQYARLSP
jgi:hypothetical protein